MRYRWIYWLAGGLAGLGIGGAAHAGPEKVAFPAGYQSDFNRYTTVDRTDRKIVRFMYVNPAGLAGATAEQAPHGTVLIMEDHKAQLDAAGEPVLDDDGRLIPTDEITNVFVMEKQPGWGADYPADVRNGEWEYAWFLADGSRKADAKFDGCFACHLGQANADFTFSFSSFLAEHAGN